MCLLTFENTFLAVLYTFDSFFAQRLAHQGSLFMGSHQNGNVFGFNFIIANSDFTDFPLFNQPKNFTGCIFGRQRRRLLFFKLIFFLQRHTAKPNGRIRRVMLQ